MTSTFNSTCHRAANNIILIGFMGSGKSSIGKQLEKNFSSKSTDARNSYVASCASSSTDYTLNRYEPTISCPRSPSATLKRNFLRLQYDYLDTDELIISKTGKTITSIFEAESESRFRELETEVLSDLSTSFKKQFILSTGGGIILSKQNRQLLKSLGTVIWLHASPEVLFERAMRHAKRPLLEVEYPRRTFNELLLKRLQLYREACDIKIDTTQLSYSKTVETLLVRMFHRKS